MEKRTKSQVSIYASSARQLARRVARFSDALAERRGQIHEVFVNPRDTQGRLTAVVEYEVSLTPMVSEDADRASRSGAAAEAPPDPANME